MKIFMKIDEIKGSATDDQFKGCIELESFDLGVSAPSPMVSGGMGQRQYKALLQKKPVLLLCLIVGNKKHKNSKKPFKWKHSLGELILWLVRWYCRYA